MQTVLNFITNYGLETVILAVAVNLLTAIIKIPIKKVANLGGVKKYTGFIVFIPIILSFILAVTFESFKNQTFTLNEAVLTTTINVASLSLAIYAVIEKVIPKNYVYMTKEELAENSAVIQKLKRSIEAETEQSSSIINEEINKETTTANEVIVLKGN